MKWLLSVFLVLIIVITLAACSGGAVSAMKSTPVKSVFDDTGKTYGEVLDAYCSDTKWRTFDSGYLTIVEFSGKTPDGQKVVIQWLKDYYDLCYAWTLDGAEQDILIDFNKWVMAAAKAQ
jgi:hypothetical protein